MRILIMTAVEAEREAVLRGLQRAGGAGNNPACTGSGDKPVGADVSVDVKLAGVGVAAAAANTMAALLQSGGCDLVVSAGIGGGFAGRAEIGELVVADAIVAADLGAETPAGYLSLDELGFGSANVQVDEARSARLTAALQAAGLAAHRGPVLTVSTATGTAETADRLAQRVPGAAAEAMEGYGVAVAAELNGLPALELRAISNAVGPRDKSAWRIKDALNALEAASALLMEGLR